MSMSRLDQLYRRLLLTKFFTHGWGKPEDLKRLFAFRKILSNRDTCQHLVSAEYPINIDKEYKDGDCRILEGHFTSPFVHHLPGIMPKEVEKATFQVILPVQWRHQTLRPICIHLAGTGDHYFWRRRFFTARPLLKETGIASILLENPYYGTRKPKEQLRSSLHNVSDLFVMGGALVLESMALLHWCEREGWGPLGLSGISMGGHMASLAATNWTRPVSLVPCLSWSTASCVFTEGVMSGAIPWETLQAQFFENSVYQDEIRKLIISPEDNRRRAYDMGLQFAKDYTNNIEKMESIHKQSGQSPELSRPHISPAMELSDLVNGHQSLHNEDTIHRSGVDNSEKAVNNVDIFCGYNYNGETSSSDKSSVTLPPQKKHVDGESVKSSINLDEVTPLSPHEYITRILPIPSPSDTRSISSILMKKDSSKVEISAQQNTQINHSPSSSLRSLVQNIASTEKSSKKDTQSGPRSLTLKYAFAKSKLMISRQPVPQLPSNTEQVKNLQQEALDFMRGVMDECTHLGNFSTPVDTELIIIVSAKQDAYVPKEGVLGLDDLWPGCEVRYVDNGHVGAVLLHQSVFRKAIADAFDRQVKKYNLNPGTQASEQHPVAPVKTANHS
ncbi:unnamed protein product [Lymnaea stagnalis]|uniref:Protein ABHD18 n=1 Tax=Lymnaea stagnalis TaxID=6523 RepID=A0AAV2HUR6_LYMST